MGRNIEDIRNVVLVCHGSECRKAGAKGLRKTARKQAKAMGIRGETLITRTRCNDLCRSAPVVCLQPANVWLPQATKEALRREMAEHLETRPGTGEPQDDPAE
jgi:(2Fe-2S) ferredoxin